MKAVLFALSLLLAFMNVSASLDFSDSKIWKISSTSEVNATYVEKQGAKVCINAMISDENDTTYKKLICSDGGVYGVAFDKIGNLWVATDVGLIRQSVADTIIYRVTDGLPSNWVKTVYYDADSNRIIIGTTVGVGLAKLDDNNKPTSWVNALPNINIDQIIVVKGEVWAINYAKVYRFTGGSWVEYSQFSAPVSGDVDRNGNFWLSFWRSLPGSTDMSRGLAKFNGQAWTEYFVSTDSAGFFGKIRIDKNNTLWFAGQDGSIGKVDLSTMIVERVSGGTLTWAPKGSGIALSITDKGTIIFAGSYAWVENISTTFIRNPLLLRNLPRGNDYQIVGTFDLAGRKIVNSFSAHSASGLRFVVVQTPQGLVVKKALIKR